MRTTETSKTVLRLAAQGHLIGEEWVANDDGGTHHHRNPATGEVQADVGLAAAAGIDAAVAGRRGGPGGLGGPAAPPPAPRSCSAWPTCWTSTHPKRPSWPPWTTAPR